MAHMIPDYINQEDPNRDGERLVFEWLASKTISGVAMHSLLQKNHKRKLIAEVDFLYISERGIICFEVKGGQVYRKNGLWYSTSKNNSEHLIKDPFVQAKDCMYALKSYVKDTYGTSAKETKYLVGYGVIFPECIFTGGGNDLVTEVLYDCSWSLDNFRDYIEKTFDYWENQERLKHNTYPDSLKDNDVNRLINLLRGDFSVIPSMNLRIQHIEKQLLEMTEEQYDALEATLRNKRVIIEGVAGTGKSLLALEKARKMIAARKKILYVCYNKNMAAMAGMSLNDADLEGSFIGTYHKLIREASGFEDAYKYNAIKISERFLNETINEHQYDCLIVDEAQDIMNIKVLESLDKFLVGGLDKGEWVMFMDPNQNIFNNNDDYNFALEYINQVYDPKFHTLTYNCRNTEQIGKRTSMLTYTSPAKHMKISGPKVVMNIYKSNREMIKSLNTEITSLLTGGTPAEDIVILSRKTLGNSILQGEPSISGLPIIETEDITRFQNKALNFFTIQSFKGLESKVVIFIDIDGFLSDKDRRLNYVGMSRAKILLYVYYPDNKKDEYLEITSKSLDLF